MDKRWSSDSDVVAHKKRAGARFHCHCKSLIEQNASIHAQDFYRRIVPLQTQFVETFTLPLTDNSLDQTIEISLKTPDAQSDMVLGTYKFALQKFQGKESPVSMLNGNYSCPGEVFN